MYLQILWEHPTLFAPWYTTILFHYQCFFKMLRQKFLYIPYLSVHRLGYPGIGHTFFWVLSLSPRKFLLQALSPYTGTFLIFTYVASPCVVVETLTSSLSCIYYKRLFHFYSLHMPPPSCAHSIIFFLTYCSWHRWTPKYHKLHLLLICPHVNFLIDLIMISKSCCSLSGSLWSNRPLLA